MMGGGKAPSSGLRRSPLSRGQALLPGGEKGRGGQGGTDGQFSAETLPPPTGCAGPPSPQGGGMVLTEISACMDRAVGSSLPLEGRGDHAKHGGWGGGSAENVGEA